MESIMLLIALIAAGTTAFAVQHFAILVDRSAAARLGRADQPAVHQDAFERLGSPLGRLLPGYFRRVESDLYWAAFGQPAWAGKTAAWIAGRQALTAAALGAAAAWLLGSSLGLLLGALSGWILMRADLAGRAGQARDRISQELPEFLQLMAAESASGAGLETILARAAQGEGYLPAWLRRVLAIAHGRELIASRESGDGVLQSEAQRSGHPDLVSFAVQMSFARQGTQVRETLARLATQFSDAYVGQAEVRSERLANSLGVLTAVFYFLPFLVVILVVIGLPLVRSF
jgi:Flp pilus assembly protein TadB